jgi:hypothetical protein
MGQIVACLPSMHEALISKPKEKLFKGERRKTAKA